MTNKTETPFQRLPDLAKRLVCRVLAGERVEAGRYAAGNQMIARAWWEAERHGFVAIERTPKGRKAWYVATETAQRSVVEARAWERMKAERLAAFRLAQKLSDAIVAHAADLHDYVRKRSLAGDPEAVAIIHSIAETAGRE